MTDETPMQCSTARKHSLRLDPGYDNLRWVWRCRHCRWVCSRRKNSRWAQQLRGAVPYTKAELDRGFEVRSWSNGWTAPVSPLVERVKENN